MGDGASVAYTGWLTNEPGFIRDLAAGDLVEFAPIHVARLLIPASHPDALEIGEKAALVSAWVLEPGAHACFAYREAADREEDSGWRLFRGDEPDEYLADSSNVRICNVTWLVDRDPTLRELFHAPVGEAFERASPSAPWVRVDDWASPSE
jgi:hypothetical protein